MDQHTLERPPTRSPLMTVLAAGDKLREINPRPDFRHAGERLAGKRILIVEDEALLAMDMQFAFEDAGADVVGPAMSLDQALAIVAQEGGIDGAILDVDLSGRDVYPVAIKLCERNVPIVFHTGHGCCQTLAATFPGAVTCSKPALPEMLIATLLRISH